MYCPRCKKQVKGARTKVPLEFADVWNDNCEICGHFLDNGVVLKTETLDKKMQEFRKKKKDDKQ